VNRADERERSRAMSSFTMFFEVGNISGGVIFGLIAQLVSQRAAFGSAVVLCVLGTWLLVARVVPRHLTRRSSQHITGQVAVVVD
jgi:MFS family permease